MSLAKCFTKTWQVCHLNRIALSFTTKTVSFRFLGQLFCSQGNETEQFFPPLFGSLKKMFWFLEHNDTIWIVPMWSQLLSIPLFGTKQIETVRSRFFLYKKFPVFRLSIRNWKCVWLLVSVTVGKCAGFQASNVTYTIWPSGSGYSDFFPIFFKVSRFRYPPNPLDKGLFSFLDSALSLEEFPWTTKIP